MLKRRRAAQINRQSIPYGSTKVEYLESTGSQYINTNYIPTNNTGYFINFQTSQTDGIWRPIFGLFNQDTSHTNRDRLYICTNPYPCLGWNKEIKQISSSDFYKTQIDCDYNFFNSRKVNLKTKSAIKSEDFPTLTYLPSVTIYLFSACNASNFNNGGSMYGFISKFIITEDNVIVCHLIPTLDSHNTPCMFDRVTRKRFYNSGRGQFNYLPPSNIPTVIPSNYTRIDYLESTGTQWIDTELCMDSYDIRICIKGQALQATDKKTTICGYWSNYGIAPEECAVFIFNDPIKNTTQTHQIMLNNWFQVSINPFEVFTIDVSRKNDNNVISIINGIQKTFSSGNKTLKSKSPETFILFGVYSHGNGSSSEVGNITNLFPGRIWYTDLYKDGIPVLKFVPCLDPTGTPCMYDTVSQKPFYNSGTDDFLYPSPTSAATYSMRRPQAEYAKMTDTGVRRLYHVPVDYEGSIEEYASENGFKLLNETESPNEEGKYYAFRWVETDTELMTEWYETEPPTDEFGQVIENSTEQQSTTFNLRRPAPIDNTVYTNNAQWAKITDTGVHKIYHTPIGYEGSLEDYAIENGYKRLIETESPSEEGKYYSFKWVETDDTLTSEWFEIDPPQDEFFGRKS